MPLTPYDMRSADLMDTVAAMSRPDATVGVGPVTRDELRDTTLIGTYQTESVLIREHQSRRLTVDALRPDAERRGEGSRADRDLLAAEAEFTAWTDTTYRPGVHAARVARIAAREASRGDLRTPL